MFTSPLSEVYGRLVVYHGSMVVFVMFVIANAVSQDTAQFLVFRFLSGCAGGTPLALGGGTIADVTSVAQRPLAMALFSLGPMFGPVGTVLIPHCCFMRLRRRPTNINTPPRYLDL